MSAAVAHRENFVVPVLCDGTLEAGAGGELRSPQEALIGAILEHDGDRVASGAELVRLESPDLAQRAREARGEATALEADREAARAEESLASAEVERRRRRVEGDERLLRSGAITREARDADVSALGEAETRWRAVRGRLDALGGKGAGSRLALAEGSASDLVRRVGGLTIRAPFPGIVYGLPRREGERVEAGQVVASIMDPLRRRVRIRVDEPDLPRIVAGEILAVTFDGLPGRRWEGRVVERASGLREEGGRRIGDVVGEIADPRGELPGNASVNVSIVVASKAGALVVPRAAIQREGSRRIVFVPDRGRARRRQVSLGLLGATDVEVTSGLEAGERVILPGAAPIEDGSPVSVSGTR